MKTATQVRVSPSTRRIAYRTRGHSGGPITRLMSPGDVGELVKPFVFLDYFDFDGRRGGGGPVHPHSGIATHTTILEGSLVYADSTDESGTLGDGSIEWMRAGGGVWHGGTPMPGEPLRGFQLWVALAPPLELAEAESRYIGGAVVPEDHWERLLLGTHRGIASPIPYAAPVTYLHVRLQDGERWTYEPPGAHDIAWLAVAKGALLVDGTALRREMAVFEEGGAPVEVVAREEVDFVIGSAVKHPYPLVTGNYSVHTSEETLNRGEAGIERVATTMKLRPGQIIPIPAS